MMKNNRLGKWIYFNTNFSGLAQHSYRIDINNGKNKKNYLIQASTFWLLELRRFEAYI